MQHCLVINLMHANIRNSWLKSWSICQYEGYFFVCHLNGNIGDPIKKLANCQATAIVMVVAAAMMAVVTVATTKAVAYRDSFKNKGDHCVNTGFPICKWGLDECCFPVCIWGTPYAYGDPNTHLGINSRMRGSPNSYVDPNMHTGIRQMSYLCMHMGIAVCIRGSQYAYRKLFKNEGIPICIWQSQYAYRDNVDVLSPYAYGDPRIHTGIPICIREFFSMLICTWEMG